MLGLHRYRGWGTAQTAVALPVKIDWHAMSIATMLPEQAVSMCTLGPVRPKYQLIRFGRIEGVMPSSACSGATSGSFATMRA